MNKDLKFDDQFLVDRDLDGYLTMNLSNEEQEVPSELVYALFNVYGSNWSDESKNQLIEKVRKFDALMSYDYFSKKNREETITRACYQLNKHLGVKDQSVIRVYEKLINASQT